MSINFCFIFIQNLLLQGIAKVGAVDAEEHRSFTQKYGVTGFPTIKIFTGSKHTPYQGQRNAEAFVDAALKATKEKAYENLGKKASSSSDKVNALKSLNSLLKSYKPVLRMTDSVAMNSSSLSCKSNKNRTFTQRSTQQSSSDIVTEKASSSIDRAPINDKQAKILKYFRSMLENYKPKE